MELNKQLKKYRIQQKLSQENLAEKIFVSRQTISNWENGKSYPDIQNLLLLSEIFDVSLDELVKGDVEHMKKKISNTKLKKLSNTFFVLLVILLIFPIPIAFFLGLWGILIILLLSIPFFLIAFKLKKITDDYDLKTYEEIIFFLENSELPDPSSREDSIIIGEKLIITMISGILSMLIIILVGFLFFKTMNFFNVHTWWY
ncbi:helix-turn-helix transcriptional regulator [Enterococcus pseudoavium]|uniref:Helix-turn-helix transcriptional regulator n=2 Tax=Enterococcus TaxID=1350 RepID=A0ABU3FL49_9ENTE|nr:MULTISPECIES: helix-turn-helix transcriptional regulator [Enterococcus]MDT2759505.1 helix-turn-helix transcriptional regulator [Enterococcus xiangfangensis]MDT2771131.1 helix-turn-helix transcriptional regulator [Enterococcus pseudoavium]